MLYSRVLIVSRSSCRRLFEGLLAAMVLCCAAVCSVARADDGPPLKVTVAACDQDRQDVLAECAVAANRLGPPFRMREATGVKEVPCQWETSKGGTVVRWLIPSIPAGRPAVYVLEHAESAPGNVMSVVDGDGFVSIRSPQREVTRYYFGDWAQKFKKPFFYPLMVQGVPITRSYPMEKKAGEDADHPHHTSVYFAHGEVNGKEYWSKLPITPKRLVERASGPVYAHIVAENAWGEELTETQDVRVMDVGGDVIMDWAITLKANDKPVLLGKTKEGGFAVRVAQGLTKKGGGKLVDCTGSEGEKAIWGHATAWADDFGKVDGKTVGVAIMNHPASWRSPAGWHARDYGLFASNAFFIQGEHELKPGEPITFRYRIFAHGGTPAEAKVKEVYAGYANAKATAE